MVLAQRPAAGPLGRQVLVATGLLALEPAVGWWMVASGLSERVEVSQYRLAAHLLIATATFGALLWAAVGLGQRPARGGVPRFAAASGVLAALVFCQIGLGALVAGLRAGLTFNTWPLMDGRLIPDGLFILSPWRRNLFEDVTTVQFDHRVLAYVVVAARAVARRSPPCAPRPASALARRALAVAGLAVVAGGAGRRHAAARRADLGGAAAPGLRDAAVRHGGRALARDQRSNSYFWLLQGAFEGHADEALVGNARARRPAADRFEELFGQAQVDRFVLGLQFEAHIWTVPDRSYSLEIGIGDEVPRPPHRL